MSWIKTGDIYAVCYSFKLDPSVFEGMAQPACEGIQFSLLQLPGVVFTYCVHRGVAGAGNQRIKCAI